MEFLSRPEDKKPRWIITDATDGPKLIEDPLTGPKLIEDPLTAVVEIENSTNEKGKLQQTSLSIVDFFVSSTTSSHMTDHVIFQYRHDHLPTS